MGWLKKLMGFQNNFTQNLLGDIGNDPSRLLTGVDPFSTAAWNGVLGTDNQPFVNAFGSPDQQYYDRAAAEGIDTGPASQFHGVADVVAGAFAANGLAGIGGGAGGAAGGAGTGTAGAAGAAGTGGAGAAGTAAAAGGGGLLSAIGGPSGALQLASGIGGALAANSGNSGNQTVTTQNQMDPRVGNILFGDQTTPGLLAQYQAQIGKPQDGNLAAYGNNNLNYLNNFGTDADAQRLAADKLMGGYQPQQVSATGQAPLAYMNGTMVNAPSQNKIDTSGSFDRFINGNAAENPYLTKAIQGGIDQSRQAFGRMQDDSTRNLMENIMPSLRSNSVLAGQYGGSRQGIAEGRAIGDFGREQQRAIENFGNNNTTAAVGAQAGAFDRGQDRALSATTNLSGQQYGVASQNAGIANAAEAMNVSRTNDVNADWARRNDGAQVQNQAAGLQANQQNQSGLLAGAGVLGGQMDRAYQVGTNQSNFGMNQLQQVNGLLQPYLGQVPGSSTTSQPTYQNTAGNLLGGAMAGLGLYNQFTQAQGGAKTGNTGSWQNVQDAWANGLGFGGTAAL
jgi:hypothetical protein